MKENTSLIKFTKTVKCVQQTSRHLFLKLVLNYILKMFFLVSVRSGIIIFNERVLCIQWRAKKYWTYLIVVYYKVFRYYPKYNNIKIALVSCISSYYISMFNLIILYLFFKQDNDNALRKAKCFIGSSQWKEVWDALKIQTWLP